MAFWRKDKNMPQMLSDLIRGLQHSVNTAMEMVESRNVELLGRYFDENGNPYIRRLNIDRHTHVNVPIISVVNHSTINVKEVEMSFNVQVVSSETRIKEAQKGFILDDDEDAEYANNLKRTNLEVSFNGRKEAPRMHVKIKFESKPVPEGLSRIIDEYDKTISPISTDEDEK